MISRIIDYIGRTVSWLSLGMVLLTGTSVLLSFLLQHGYLDADINIIALQELTLYLHATLIMVGISYTLRHQGHVRIDIFYGRFSPKTKALVDILGILLLLLPLTGFWWWMSYEYVLDSWDIFESSPEAGGLPLVYVLKSLLLVAPVLLALQSIADLTTNIKQLKGHS
jgi:TRAP-type mannitol/chloroaromatic compound transport system permease small subunit